MLPVASHSGCRKFRPPDPPHPDCAPEPANGSSFAIALHGSVTGRVWGSAAKLLASGRDEPLEQFVDVEQTRRDLESYVVTPSGGAHLFDFFIHSSVPSTAVQAALLQLYKPTAARFNGGYARMWGPGLKATAAKLHMSAAEASRWASAAAALQLVREAEVARGRRYTRIMLSRPDMHLWRAVQLPSYCADRVYVNICGPPYHRRDCAADFHLVFSSENAERFATLPSHFGRFRFGAWEHGKEAISANQMLERFVTSVVGVPLLRDHVVAGRHEEVARKALPKYESYGKQPRRDYFRDLPCNTGPLASNRTLPLARPLTNALRR